MDVQRNDSPFKQRFYAFPIPGVSLEYLITGKVTDKASQVNEEILALLRTAREKLKGVY